MSKKELEGNVLASCDDTGVTVINEDACFTFEDGPVEVAYINLDEEMMLSDAGNNEDGTSGGDDTRSSMQSSENPGLDFMDCESDYEVSNNFDTANLEIQVAVTNNFFEGKLTFQEFLTTVESEDENDIENESSDEEREKDVNVSIEDDPDYLPSKKGESHTGKLLKTVKGKTQKHSVQRTAGNNSENESSVSNLPKKKNISPAKVKGRKYGQKVIKRLPPALQGNLNNIYHW